jgi:hypothetical protein
MLEVIEGSDACDSPRRDGQPRKIGQFITLSFAEYFCYDPRCSACWYAHCEKRPKENKVL